MKLLLTAIFVRLITFIKKTGKGNYPVIVLTTPKGWTGPKEVGSKRMEGSFRAHQVPLTIDSDEDLNLLYEWLKSYHPENLFDAKDKIKKDTFCSICS